MGSECMPVSGCSPPGGLRSEAGKPAVRVSTHRYHLLGHFHIPKQEEVMALRFPDDGKGICALKAGAPKKLRGTAGTLFKPGPGPE